MNAATSDILVLVFAVTIMGGMLALFVWGAHAALVEEIRAYRSRARVRRIIKRAKRNHFYGL